MEERRWLYEVSQAKGVVLFSDCMKKNIPVIGYQPDTLCTRKDLEKFDTIWWASRPVEPLVNNYKPQKFELTETAKYVFGSTVHFIKAIPKL